ncbi:MAG: acyl-CoA dehydrogenase family protein [Myxococcota bacterium]
MPNYTPPVDDIRFLLETFDYAGQIAALPAFADFDVDTAMSMVSEYARFCVEVLQPLNRTGDAVGVRYDPANHTVTLPDGFKAAYEGFCENGFTAIPYEPAHGGMGAPMCLSTLAGEILIAANKSLSMCSSLTGGLVEALQAHGTPEQQADLLPKLIPGTWAGTMCLTEPQCGTDLGLLTTRAEVHGDHFALTGTKIWITFGGA